LPPARRHARDPHRRGSIVAFIIPKHLFHHGTLPWALRHAVISLPGQKYCTMPTPGRSPAKPGGKAEALTLQTELMTQNTSLPGHMEAQETRCRHSLKSDPISNVLARGRRKSAERFHTCPGSRLRVLRRFALKETWRQKVCVLAEPPAPSRKTVV